jgi:GH24 family phage-related lysozyme (muramidase)
VDPSVLSDFPAWTAQFEGRTHYMYLDALGLVTCGVGNLIDPIETALGLPWLLGGVRATRDRIAENWRYVKACTSYAKLGGFAFENLPSNVLRLSDASVDNLVRSRMQSDWAFLLKRYPGADAAPVPAQRALLSMAWAMGPGFDFPKFAEAFNAQDWATCAVECVMRPSPGIALRNAANVALFRSLS